MELKFRPLKAEEIEVRIGSTTKKTYSLLLYKNARVDMALLDEVVGQGKWQREHKILGTDIYCRVGIWNEELKQWVWKEDAGSSGNIEIEKSKASDSFKRVCVNIGIGRELYSAPEIKLWKENENDDSYKYKKFYVKEIDYEKGEISKLVICDQENDSVVYSYPKGAKVSQNAQKQGQNTTTPPKASYTPNDIAKEMGECLTKVKGFATNLPAENYKKFFGWLEEKYNTRVINELTLDQLKEIIRLYKL